MIKKGDRILVHGESDEVFCVIEVQDNRVFLSSGCSEPMAKCVKIPDEDLKDIYSIIKEYLPTEISMKLFRT